MSAQTIDLQSDGTMPAYVAEPASAPRGGVVVVQEIFGISPPMKAVADLLAGEGYLAIVPAMFHRVDPQFVAEYDDAGRTRGIEAMKVTTHAQSAADVAAATAYLRAHLPDGARIAVWGFCWGGSVAYLAATLPAVDAAVSFYGGQIARSPIPGMPPLLEVTNAIRAPLLLAFGGRDTGIPPSDVASIRGALDEAGKRFALEVYPEADHAFFRPGPASSASAAAAWSRVRTFLDEHVAG